MSAKQRLKIGAREHHITQCDTCDMDGLARTGPDSGLARTAQFPFVLGTSIEKFRSNLRDCDVPDLDSLIDTVVQSPLLVRAPTETIGITGPTR